MDFRSSISRPSNAQTVSSPVFQNRWLGLVIEGKTSWQSLHQWLEPRFPLQLVMMNETTHSNVPKILLGKYCRHRIWRLRHLRLHLEPRKISTPPRKPILLLCSRYYFKALNHLLLMEILRWVTSRFQSTLLGQLLSAPPNSLSLLMIQHDGPLRFHSWLSPQLSKKRQNRRVHTTACRSRRRVSSIALDSDTTSYLIFSSLSQAS